MPFTHLEKCDMLESYIFCRKIADRALEDYQQKFPDRNLPDRRYFLILYRKFRSNGNVFKKGRTKKQFILNENTEINVLAYFGVNKNNSVRDLAKETGLNINAIWRVLKKHHFIPYKYRPVQTLVPGDTLRRITFCRWLCNAYGNDAQILRKIIWSDESSFSNRGMFNRKNMHYWSEENLFFNDPRNPQVRFSTNVWCGLIGSRIVGPVFYEGTLSGRRYIEFVISGVLAEFLDDLNLEDRVSIYFQQDGAPPHQLNQVRTLLQRMFRGKWISTNGPIRWPPRSPDLTPLDFYFWGYLKDEVYKSKYANVEELQIKIRQVIRSIDGRTILKATKRVLKCAQKCIEQEGDVFEHLM